MTNIVMYMGVFILGYLLTMGFLYVILNLFPKRQEPGITGIKGVSINPVMKISKGSAGESKPKASAKPKMRFING